MSGWNDEVSPSKMQKLMAPPDTLARPAEEIRAEQKQQQQEQQYRNDAHRNQQAQQQEQM